MGKVDVSRWGLWDTLQHFFLFRDVRWSVTLNITYSGYKIIQTAFLRARSAEDDFRLAAASLVLGHADEDDDERKPDNGKSKTRTEKDGQARAQGFNKEGQDISGKNGFLNSQDCTKKKPAGRATKDQSNKAPLQQPAEHVLQKAITSFDMALGELNQLAHLIDLARAGEFMVLDRVTPSEEDQARALLDKAVSPSFQVIQSMCLYSKFSCSLLWLARFIRSVLENPKISYIATRVVYLVTSAMLRIHAVLTKP